MKQIGILGEFFHDSNEYALRHYSETDYLDDEVINFDNKAQLRTYLSNLQKDPTIWTVLNTVARNFGLDACRTTIDRCDREDLDYLCDKIHSEEWVLIIKKYHGIKSVKLEQCCIKLAQKINSAITNSAITSAILITLPFFKAFFYPYQEKVANMASSAMSVSIEDWKLLADAIKGVTKLLVRVLVTMQRSMLSPIIRTESCTCYGRRFPMHLHKANKYQAAVAMILLLLQVCWIPFGSVPSYA